METMTKENNSMDNKDEEKVNNRKINPIRKGGAGVVNQKWDKPPYPISYNRHRQHKITTETVHLIVYTSIINTLSTLLKFLTPGKDINTISSLYFRFQILYKECISFIVTLYEYVSYNYKSYLHLNRSYT
uniref:Uncharacterized protein n=1 Tax=Cacopsylla melanoneura TaxID=428564 RepID=A0A8D9BMB7_9HEMI